MSWLVSSQTTRLPSTLESRAESGLVNEFARIRRDMMLAIEAPLFPAVEGSTDSEVLFYVALSLGLERDPVTAMEETIKPSPKCSITKPVVWC